MIREAKSSDIPAMAGIYNEAIAEGGFTGDILPVTLESRELWFAEHRVPYALFVIEADGSVVGYVSLSPYRKGRPAFRETCEIAYYVSRAYRGRGIGKALVSHAIEHAVRGRFRVLVAILLGSNERSMKFLERFEFSECGRVRGAARIDGNLIDHLFMSRHLREPGSNP